MHTFGQVYQKAVLNPMMSIEQLWKEYTSFEQSINPIIAEKMTQERSRDYMTARRVAKEYEAVTRGLNKQVRTAERPNPASLVYKSRYRYSGLQNFLDK